MSIKKFYTQKIYLFTSSKEKKKVDLLLLLMERTFQFIAKKFNPPTHT